MSEVKLTVSSHEAFFGRLQAMAKRIDAGDYTPQSAEVNFETAEQLLKVLTPNRWVLLRKLKGLGETSIRRLSQELGRDYRGVHADVAALLELDLIEKTEAGQICVPWDKITAELSVEQAA